MTHTWLDEYSRHQCSTIMIETRIYRANCISANDIRSIWTWSIKLINFKKIFFELIKIHQRQNILFVSNRRFCVNPLPKSFIATSLQNCSLTSFAVINRLIDMMHQLKFQSWIEHKQPFLSLTTCWIVLRRNFDVVHWIWPRLMYFIKYLKTFCWSPLMQTYCEYSDKAKRSR